MSVLFAIVGLGALIVVHELGHMLVARGLGMRVEKFSVGFGPALLRWRGKRTVYQLAAVPLGGFVHIAGMNPHEPLPEGDPGSYANKSPGARFATILAGPLTNYLFAIVIMLGVLLAWGVPKTSDVVGGVADVAGGSPAAKGGLRPGDVIVTIDGTEPRTNRHVTELIQEAGGKPQTYVVRRGEETHTLQVAATRSGEVYRIGITFDQRLEFADVGPGRAVLLALAYPFIKSAEVIGNLGLVFSGKVGVDQMGGPLEIVRQLKMSFEDSLVMALIFLAMLNVFLGLFNLFPIPALDGGRLIFLLYTLVTRRPVNQRIENAVHTVGFLLLLGLIALITLKDATRIFGSE